MRAAMIDPRMERRTVAGEASRATTVAMSPSILAASKLPKPSDQRLGSPGSIA